MKQVYVKLLIVSSILPLRGVNASDDGAKFDDTSLTASRTTTDYDRLPATAPSSADTDFGSVNPLAPILSDTALSPEEPKRGLLAGTGEISVFTALAASSFSPLLSIGSLHTVAASPGFAPPLPPPPPSGLVLDELPAAPDPENNAISQLVRGGIHPAVAMVHDLLTPVRAAHLTGDSRPQGRRFLKNNSNTRNFNTAAVGHAYRDGNKHRWQGAVASNPLETLSVGGIHTAFRAALASRPSSPLGVPSFYCVEGVDAAILGTSPCAAGGIVQVSSDFAFAQFTTAGHIPVQNLSMSWAQGTRASLSCLSATIVRDYWTSNLFTLAQHQPLFARLPPAVYNKGCFRPHHLTADQEAILTARLGTLRILGQWAQPEGTGHHVLQVFTATPSFEGVAQPRHHTLCESIVANQYRATAQLAVLRSFYTDQQTSLHLTPLGQGRCLNNPESAFRASVLAVLETVQGYPIRVYWHGRNPEYMAIIRRSLPDGLAVTNMADAEFFAPHVAVGCRHAAGAASAAAAGTVEIG